MSELSKMVLGLIRNAFPPRMTRKGHIDGMVMVAAASRCSLPVLPVDFNGILNTDLPHFKYLSVVIILGQLRYVKRVMKASKISSIE